MPNTTIANACFHHIALKVLDFDQSMKFYTEGLGLAVYRTWGEGDGRAAMLDLGDGGCIEIFAGGKPFTLPDGASGAFMHLAIGTTNAKAALDRAVALGCEVTVPLGDVDIPSNPVLPVTIAFVKGPNGEIIEFFEKR